MGFELKCAITEWLCCATFLPALATTLSSKHLTVPLPAAPLFAINLKYLKVHANSFTAMHQQCISLQSNHAGVGLLERLGLAKRGVLEINASHLLCRH